jgi:hypothetical protein
MTSNREQVVTGLVAVGLFLMGGQIHDPGLAAFVVGISGNLVANVVQAVTQHYADYPGATRVQLVLKRAAHQAARKLKEDYLQEDEFQKLYPTEKVRLDGVFATLGAEVGTSLVALTPSQAEQALPALLGGDQTALQQALQQHLEPVLPAGHTHLRAFLAAHLVPKLAEAFAQELDTDKATKRAIEALAHPARAELARLQREERQAAISERQFSHRPLLWDDESRLREILITAFTVEYVDSAPRRLFLQRCGFTPAWIEDQQLDMASRDVVTELLEVVLEQQYSAYALKFGPHCSMVGTICLGLIHERAVANETASEFLVNLINNYRLLDPEKTAIPPGVIEFMDRRGLRWYTAPPAAPPAPPTVE